MTPLMSAYFPITVHRQMCVSPTSENSCTTAGFTVLKEDASDGVERDEVLEREIDFEKTRAYLKDDKGFDIWINAEPGPKFDEIERDLLLALRTWVDEDIGRNVVAIALPKTRRVHTRAMGRPVRRRHFRMGSRICPAATTASGKALWEAAA